MALHIQLDDSIDEDEVINLYQANKWSSAEKPARLMSALRNTQGLSIE